LFAIASQPLLLQPSGRFRWHQGQSLAEDFIDAKRSSIDTRLYHWLAWIGMTGLLFGLFYLLFWVIAPSTLVDEVERPQFVRRHMTVAY